jgi:multidrug resistance efflux pump
MSAASAQAFSLFLQIERAARKAATRAELGYAIVNETRRLVPYRQAVLFAAVGAKRLKVEAISAVSVTDAEAPLVRFLAHALRGLGADGKTVALDNAALAGTLPADLHAEWQSWMAAHTLWLPLTGPDGRRLAGLCVTRDEPFAPGDVLLLEQLADAYAHAWRFFVRGQRSTWRWTRILLPLAAAGIVAAGFMPVPQTALAPAEIVARDAFVVAAPMDGVVAKLEIGANARVEPGTVLLRYDDTALRARRDVAMRAVDVARADLRRASQAAFTDRQSGAQVAMLEAQARLRETEVAAAEEMLARVELRAERSGIALIGEVDDWTGRPVRTGERVLRIADPSMAELRIDVAPADAAMLGVGEAVTLFLDSDPLRPLAARIVSTAYEAQRLPDGTLAYRVTAELDQTQGVRIGLRGTARIEGPQVPLAFYLFRRPIAALRQMVGR